MAAEQEFEAKYPNIKIKRVSRSFDDLKTTLRLALSATMRRTSYRRTTGARTWAVRQGRAAGAAGQVGRGVRLATGTRRRCAVLAVLGGRQDLRRGQPLRHAAGRRGRRHLLQQGQAGQGRDHRPKTWAEFEDALAKPKPAGELPMQFGNLDKWPAIHVFGTVQDKTMPADQITTLAFGGRVRRGRRRRTPRPPRRWSPGWTRATSTKASTGRATTRPGRTSARARASS